MRQRRLPEGSPRVSVPSEEVERTRLTKTRRRTSKTFTRVGIYGMNCRMPRRPLGSLVKIAPRFRVLFREQIELGPGKVELLKAIQETGSIRKAAAHLGMSHMKAWLLVRTMNRCFRSPVVHSERGGAAKGGAKLTDIGTAAVRLYEQLESETLAITQQTRQELTSLLREK